MFVISTEQKLWFKIFVYLLLINSFSFSLSIIGVIGFSAIPYIRMFSVFIIFLLFFRYYINLSKWLKLYKIKNAENLLILIFLIGIIIDFIIGGLYRNPLIYLLGDFLFILNGIILYNITTQLINKYLRTYQTILILKKSFFLFLFLNITFYLLNFKLEGTAITFLISLLILFLIYKQYIYFFFLLAISLYNFQNRATFFSFLVLIFIYYLSKVDYKKIYNKIKVLFSFFLLLFSTIIITWIIYKYLPKSHPLVNRIEQLILLINMDFENKNLIPILQRIIEAKLVIEQWTSDIFHIIFGSGLGATISGKYVIDTSVINASFIGTDAIHNIHILPFALLHKFGLIGMIIFLILLYLFLKSIKFLINNIDISRIKKNENLLLYWANVYFIVIFLFSLPASSFLWTNPLFWIALAIKKRGFK